MKRAAANRNRVRSVAPYLMTKRAYAYEGSAKCELVAQLRYIPGCAADQEGRKWLALQQREVQKAQ